MGKRKYPATEPTAAADGPPGTGTRGRKRRSQGGRPPATSVPCQVPECGAELVAAAGYYKRYRVCPDHSVAEAIHLSGKHQRFCFQCGRFHAVAAFDSNLRSCREALARRRARLKQQSSSGSGDGSGGGSGGGKSAQARQASPAPPQQRAGKIGKAANAAEGGSRSGSCAPGQRRLPASSQAPSACSCSGAGCSTCSSGGFSAPCTPAGTPPRRARRAARPAAATRPGGAAAVAGAAAAAAAGAAAATAAAAQTPPAKPVQREDSSGSQQSDAMQVPICGAEALGNAMLSDVSPPADKHQASCGAGDDLVCKAPQLVGSPTAAAEVAAATRGSSNPGPSMRWQEHIAAGAPDMGRGGVLLGGPLPPLPPPPPLPPLQRCVSASQPGSLHSSEHGSIGRWDGAPGDVWLPRPLPGSRPCISGVDLGGSVDLSLLLEPECAGAAPLCAGHSWMASTSACVEDWIQGVLAP